MENLSVRLVESKKELEAFIKSREEANFLQSWNWGQFHTNLGKKVFYFGLYDSGRLIAVSLAVKEEARRGTYSAAPC